MPPLTLAVIFRYKPLLQTRWWISGIPYSGRWVGEGIIGEVCFFSKIEVKQLLALFSWCNFQFLSDLWEERTLPPTRPCSVTAMKCWCPPLLMLVGHKLRRFVHCSSLPHLTCPFVNLPLTIEMPWEQAASFKLTVFGNATRLITVGRCFLCTRES